MRRFPIASLSGLAPLASLCALACADEGTPLTYSQLALDAGRSPVGIPVSPGRTEDDAGGGDDDAAPVEPHPSATSTGTVPRLVPPMGSAGATAIGGAGGGETNPVGDGGASAETGSGGAPDLGGSGGLPTLLDASVPDLPPVEPGDYAVVCRDGNNGTTESAQFSVDLSLLNFTDEAIPIDEISVRYWFSSDNESDPTLTGHSVFVDDASPTWGGTGNVQHDVVGVVPAEEGADTYVELSFGSSGCGNCNWPGSERGTIPQDSRPTKLRVQIEPSALRYDLSNDYSYNPDADGDTICQTITLYRRGTLIFGIEPDGTTVAEGDAGVAVDAGPTEVDAGVAGSGAAGSGAGGSGAAGGQGGSAVDAGSPGGLDAGAPDTDASLPSGGAGAGGAASGGAAGAASGGSSGGGSSP